MSSEAVPTAPAAPATQLSIAICYPSGRVGKVKQQRELKAELDQGFKEFRDGYDLGGDARDR